MHQLFYVNKIFRKCLFYRMKKKRKRSASSSSSSSSTSSRRNSSSSSSSSSRRRSKKKKKKRHRSERGSKRHRRISSRDSRRSEEGKSEKDRKEDEEVEWYPAPPNTSATFLNQKGGPGFGERDEEEAEEKGVEERRISQLYSLSAASDDEESDSSHRGRKTKDRTRRGKNSLCRSPERAERMSGSRETRGRSKERVKEDNRKDRRDSDSRRRSSLDEDRKRKASCSSAESVCSRKSNVKSEHFGNWTSKQVESRLRHDASKRNSFDGGRYENRGREEIWEVEAATREKDGSKGRVEEEGSRSEGGNSTRSDGAGNHKQSGLTSVPGGRPKKDLPSNLLDIFNQIAQFEKEKGVRPK